MPAHVTLEELQSMHRMAAALVIANSTHRFKRLEWTNGPVDEFTQRHPSSDAFSCGAVTETALLVTKQKGITPCQ
jgi:hypothetical protein